MRNPLTTDTTGNAAPDSATSQTMTEQIVAHLRRQIERGDLQPGDRLPSSRRLASEFGVSLNTVQAALGRLQAMGLADCSPRRRGVVKEAGRRARGRNNPGLVLMFGEPGADYSSFSSSWGSQILYAAEHALSLRNITVVKVYVPTVDHKIPPQEIHKISDLLKSAGAVIWLASGGLQPLIGKAIERGVPCVTVNAPSDLVANNLIKADNVGGGRIAGQVFARLDYQRCLLLTRGIRYRRFAPELAQGFIDSYMKAGIPLRGIDYHDLEFDRAELAHDVVRQYLKQNPTPQGIFAVSDTIAIGAMAACQAAGLSIPNDVGVLSATGFEEACLQSRPTLSAWRQPTQNMGVTAADMLLRLMERPEDRLPPVLVGSSLYLRDSLPRHGDLVDLPGVEIPPSPAS